MIFFGTETKDGLTYGYIIVDEGRKLTFPYIIVAAMIILDLYEKADISEQEADILIHWLKRLKLPHDANILVPSSLPEFEDNILDAQEIW